MTTDESIEQIEITALEKYIRTGERDEHLSGVKIGAETEKKKEEEESQRDCESFSVNSL